MRKKQKEQLVENQVNIIDGKKSLLIEANDLSINPQSRDNSLILQYQKEIENLERQMRKLDANYKGMIEREKKYLKNISDLKENVENSTSNSLSRQDFLKLQTSYEGLLAREERYLKEIKQLQDQIQDQKNSLYRTYSYRLGYLLIHATKSIKNFISLPADLMHLYRDNKHRKKLKSEALNLIKDSSEVKSLVKNKPRFSSTHAQLVESYLEEEREIKIATIMDEFTSLCFAPEAETLQITPNNFKNELIEFKPDFVFIESAWQGKDGLWKLKVSQQAEELFELIEFCQKNNIKTLFWNKEDPVHFGTFIEVAKQVDVVFTTDIDCIQKYKEAVQHNDVYLMPFAAQPKVHNPIELYERIDKFNFAGSYYLKYPVRQRDFSVLSDVAINSRGLDIYDRNFNNDHPHYQFPERYQSLILGSLPPEEIDKAYKGYEFGINMNTIKQSQTMFARRVFEMLASNTIVLSNYSRGVRLLFGDLVVCSDNKGELQRQVDNILVDEITRKKFKLQGLRSVLSQHTYEHRLNYILQKLKIYKKNKSMSQHVAVLVKCETQADIDWAIEQFNHQSIEDKTLLIETSIAVESSSNIKAFKNHQEVLEALIALDATHVTVFNSDDYYGQNYLIDMLLSYHYLKYHNNCPVTKDRYYSYSKDQLLDREGKEYLFVDEYQTSKTLYTKKYFIDLLNQYDFPKVLKGLLIQEKAFSSDALNYIDNGKAADQANIALVCQDLVLDAGVSLSNHLLPIAENITFNNCSGPAMEKCLLVDEGLVKETLRKEIKFSIENKTVLLDSHLPNDQHRLVALTQPLEVEKWNRINIKNLMEYDGDVLFVFQFLDKDHQQLTYATVIPTTSFTLDIPEGTVFGQLSVRLKGKSNVKVQQELQIRLDNVARRVEKLSYDSDDIILFSKDDMDKELVRPKNKQIQIINRSNGVEIKSTLENDKHAYIYFRTIFTREEVNLVLNSIFETVGEIVDCDFRTVFLFLDQNKEKLAHSIIKVDNHSHAMAIPEACKYVRIGFKVMGRGSANVQTLKIGEIREQVNNLIGKSDTLVLAKQYPAYDDLYKYGFLHSRLRAYKKENTVVDMFRFANNTSTDFREFESIDIFQGGKKELVDALASGQFKRVFIHLIDQAMWDIVKAFKDTIQIYIWIHGAEIQTWQRRSFEFDRMTNDQISRQKKLSARRVTFWQNLLDKELNENVNFIFVSQYLRAESEEGLARVFPNKQTHIIHNYVDENIFPYEVKDINQRYNLLTIRPFAGKKYANDVTVNAIIALSKKTDFSKYKVEICGDGELFDETVAPLKGFQNVIINKGFLSHSEMAEKYSEYGVFINPTRWDSQGVSRDEARIAGLVSVSSRVTAIPEFVSDEDGIMVDMEDYEALADEIIKMAENPNIYSTISKNGHERVIQQCGLGQTISKELNLISAK
ncbi:glycosyltransferase family protein [Wohlfahrtiimonas larvae]|uniref:Spore protein YkvP/CgeB glycosyl transferase-like domain-containing protein n=1 Tax=Wohlfahrtiimonas larvae TaxID=1157986 RepID=A0ABP9MQY2_9GAMM|nr:glycosyltransferase [Wohlfahrtiimonas larvae]